MTESLSERIARREGRHRSGRAEFLAVRDDVRQALADGWSVKAVWSVLHEEGTVTCGYWSFGRYVRRYITGVRSDTPAPRPATPGRFTHNPKPTTEDLV